MACYHIHLLHIIIMAPLLLLTLALTMEEAAVEVVAEVLQVGIEEIEVVDEMIEEETIDLADHQDNNSQLLSSEEIVVRWRVLSPWIRIKCL